MATVRRPVLGADLVVVMGVSGSGKTTAGRALAEALGWDFAEGDTFHSTLNVAKMASGSPLTDADRGPWLLAIGAWLTGCQDTGRSAVVTCSALRRSYRDVLRAGRPGVRFCELATSPDLALGRLADRVGHYMPASLLASQLLTLESLQPDEPGVVVDAVGTPQQVVARAIRALGL